jgi:hypothetical protein
MPVKMVLAFEESLFSKNREVIMESRGIATIIASKTMPTLRVGVSN